MMTPSFLTTSSHTPISSSMPCHCLQPMTIHSFLHPTHNTLMQCSSPAFKMSWPLQQPQNSQKEQWRWPWQWAQYVSRLVYHTSNSINKIILMPMSMFPNQYYDPFVCSTQQTQCSCHCSCQLLNLGVRIVDYISCPNYSHIIGE